MTKPPKSGKGIKFTATDEMREKVELLTSFGLKVDEVAAVVGVSVNTIEKHFPKELKAGHEIADSKVVQNLFRIATGSSPQAATAAIFWSKVRLRWHEVQRVIHGFDPGIVAEFVRQVVSVIRRVVPDACPHCKAKLSVRMVVVTELRELGQKMAQSLPQPELVPLEKKDPDHETIDGVARREDMGQVGERRDPEANRG